ncbi:hypothetical protein ACF09J_26165 [Streptomyces sp. NPDC014889]|uniref:hypothetical protein n=1 Tax=Streptomyces sp. NPDC014889 TaxID=3364928 RepID=UPI0036F4C4D2
MRQLKAVGGPAGALVAMAVGGKAMLPGGEDRIPLPWARVTAVRGARWRAGEAGAPDAV